MPVPGKNCSGEELDPAAACLKKTAYFAKKVIYKKNRDCILEKKNYNDNII